MKEKRIESLQLHKQTEPKLQVLVKKTKELQSQVMYFKVSIIISYEWKDIHLIGSLFTYRCNKF